MKNCKYCTGIITNARNNTQMCKRCRRIDSNERSRLHMHFKRNNIKRDGNEWILKPLACPFCYKFIIGRRVCRDCANIREIICEKIIEQLKATLPI